MVGRSRPGDAETSASWLFGIEFEYLLVGRDGAVRDFRTLAFPEVSAALDEPPGRADPLLHTGDLGIKSGYWYLEGDERFDDAGMLTDLLIKGAEIRTPPQSTMADTIEALTDIEAELSTRLADRGLRLAIGGHNPELERYRLEPPLNAWEIRMREEHPEYARADISNVTFGPDLNFSHSAWDDDDCRRIGRKLTHYSPYLVPFSFSAPFRCGEVWSGPSLRTFARNGLRPAVRVYVADPQPPARAGDPVLETPARSASERGRIEFKAFDAIASLDLISALFALVLGTALADDLPGRADAPDRDLLQRAGEYGWKDPDIRSGAAEVLAAARRALQVDGELSALVGALDPLESLLDRLITPADLLVDHYRRTGLMYLAAPIPRRLDAI